MDMMEAFEANFRVASTAGDLMDDVMDNWCQCHYCEHSQRTCGSCWVGTYTPGKHTSADLLDMAVRAYRRAVELEEAGSTDGAKAWAKAWTAEWIADN